MQVELICFFFLKKRWICRIFCCLINIMKNFNPQKMLAAVAYVCQSNENKFDKLALIKVLYLAERDSICQTFSYMTGDEMLRYRFGPILKHLHDALRGKSTKYFQNLWDKYLKNPDAGSNDVFLIETPDMGELSFADKSFLNSAIKTVNSCPHGELVEEIHKLPEWDAAFRHGKSRIDLVDILHLYRPDLTSEEILDIKRELEPA